MRSILCERLGDPACDLASQDGPLRLAIDVPTPPLQPGHVRIQVAACSLNFADALMVQGKYQEKPPLPFTPGSEVAGVVAEVAPDVRAFEPGQRVVALTQGGGLAEQVVVHEGAVWRLPDQATDLQAAAGLPVAFGTSYMALVQRAGITAGQTVLVLGAAGGVGTAAVQIAKACNCRVIAVARGADKARMLYGLGADAVVDSSALDGKPLHVAIKAHAPSGVDVVYDPVGGDSFKAALRCVAWGGQLLVIGFASGGVPAIPANILLVKNLTVHGIYWGAHLQRRPRVLREGMLVLLAWLAEGRVCVPVSHRLPLQRADEAFRTLLSRKALGKVLVLPGGEAARL